MASRRLGSTPFVELLPDSIAGDPTIRAASEALDPALAASVGAIPSLLLFARLGLVGGEGMLAPLARLAELSGGLSPLPEDVIDSLAWQLHVDGYEYAAGPDVKREMVRNSLLLHRRRGTPWAVRRALEIALRMPVTVREWFETDGEPYSFTLELDVTGSGLSDDMLANVSRIVANEKNVRSWLEVLETSTRIELPLSYGAADITRTHACVYGYMDAPAPPRAKLNIGLAVSGRSLSVLALSLPDVPPALPLPVGIAAVVRERTRGAFGIYQEETRPSAVSDVPVLACIARTRSRIAAE